MPRAEDPVWSAECDYCPSANHAVVGTGQQHAVRGMQIAVRNETALFTGRRESLSTLVRWVSCQFDLVLRWRPRHLADPVDHLGSALAGN